MFVTGALSLVHATATNRGIYIETPPVTAHNDLNTTTQTRVYGDEEDLFYYIQTINEYLWFSIAALCFGVLIYSGFKMVASEGEEGSFTSATNTMKWAGIGIGIALLSYAVIRLVVNLF